MHLRAELLAGLDKNVKSSITLTRPRGYFDAARDSMRLDGKSLLPGVPATGAGVSASKISLDQDGIRSISAEFNKEKITGLTWPVAQNRVVILELTY